MLVAPNDASSPKSTQRIFAREFQLSICTHNVLIETLRLFARSSSDNWKNEKIQYCPVFFLFKIFKMSKKRIDRIHSSYLRSIKNWTEMFNYFVINDWIYTEMAKMIAWTVFAMENCIGRKSLDKWKKSFGYRNAESNLDPSQPILIFVFGIRWIHQNEAEFTPWSLQKMNTKSKLQKMKPSRSMKIQAFVDQNKWLIFFTRSFFPLTLFHCIYQVFSCSF